MPVLGKTKQEVLSEFRCSEILEAARRVFAKKGFSQATVEDIAEAAEVAKGTVYLYFRSKREIYLAALRQGILALKEETRKNLEAAQPVEEKVRVFIETRINYCEENRDFFKIYHSEFGNLFGHPASVNKDFKNLYIEQARMLERVLEEGIRRNELRPIPAGPTAFTISDLTRSLIARRLLGWSKASAAEDVAFLFDLLWKGIEKQ